METKLGILAIGNEVVDGQITNGNAAWLSEELGNLGLTPLYHLSCRDNPNEILDSLRFLEKYCHLIVVSGGLGPTKDDRTRQALSEWLQIPLQHNEEQWQIIKNKLGARKVTLREGHKQQALLPEGSVALPNSKGVAPGFFVKAKGCFLASLPGPPSELHAMVKEHLSDLIINSMSPKKEKQLKTWICLGAPESEIAHISESILGDEEIGYRLHKPYVELKVWISQENSPEFTRKVSLMEEKLKPWLVGRSIKSIRKNFHDYLNQFQNVFVIDHLTQGLFLEKLKEDFRSNHLRYQCFEHKAFRFFSSEEVKNILSNMGIEQNPSSLFISLFPASESSANISFNSQIMQYELPRAIPVQSKLGQLYTIEKCFLHKSHG